MWPSRCNISQLYRLSPLWLCVYLAMSGGAPRLVIRWALPAIQMWRGVECLYCNLYLPISPHIGYLGISRILIFPANVVFSGQKWTISGMRLYFEVVLAICASLHLGWPRPRYFIKCGRRCVARLQKILPRMTMGSDVRSECSIRKVSTEGT